MMNGGTMSSKLVSRQAISLVLSLLFRLTTSLVLSGCGASLELTSEWSTQEVKVDGVSDEWTSFQSKIAGPDARIGVRNDNNNLYVCVTTPSRTTQFQMLALGTTVWFDAEGSKNKSLGIRFPLPAITPGRRMTRPTKSDDVARFMEGLVNTAQRQFEIIGPGAGERKKFADRQAKGVDVHLGYNDGALTIELKMPLQRGIESPYGLTSDASKSLSIGFETGDYRELMGSQMGTSGPPAGGGGGRGGGRGGGGGGGSMGGGDTPEGLKLWLVVHLAAGAAK